MMFRLVGRPAPAVDFEALVLAQAYRFTRGSNALYPDAREPLMRLPELVVPQGVSINPCSPKEGACEP